MAGNVSGSGDGQQSARMAAKAGSSYQLMRAHSFMPSFTTCLDARTTSVFIWMAPLRGSVSRHSATRRLADGASNVSEAKSCCMHAAIVSSSAGAAGAAAAALADGAALGAAASADADAEAVGAGADAGAAAAG